MKAELFVDTAFWIALLNPRDSLHQRALELADAHTSAPLITTQEVFVELLNYFSRLGSALRGVAISFIDQASGQSNLLVLEQSSASFESGVKLYGQRLDKS